MIPAPSTLAAARRDALSYADFMALGEPHGHQPQWDQRYAQAELTPEQSAMIAAFKRRMTVICLTGTWCGDCALQGAAMQRVAEANPDAIDLRFVLKSEDQAELVVRSQINAGFRVPMSFFFSEDDQLVHSFGDRTLSRYRGMARKDPRTAGHVLAPAPENPVLAVRDEVVWMFERVQLILRLSGRLREKHGD